MIFTLPVAFSAHHFLQTQAEHIKQYDATLELAGKLSRDQSIYEQITTLVEDEQKPVLALNGINDAETLKKRIYVEQDQYARGEQRTQSLERQLDSACYILVCLALITPALLTASLTVRRQARPVGAQAAQAVRVAQPAQVAQVTVHETA